MATETELLTPGQVAEILCVSRASVSRLAKDGLLPCVRITTRIVRFRRDDIDRLLVSGVPTGPEAVAS